jgi:hypothetical protein
MYDPTTGRFLSDDRVFNVGDPQGMNGYVYADNRPTSSSDASGYKAGSVGAHETAIMLRMAALRAAYPNAIIQGSIPSNQGGPDLVCWGCKPGEVWVWEFKSENDRAGDTNFDLEVLYHMAQAQQDPRTGTDAVVAGPTFASIGLPPIQVGANHANPDELVTVYDYAPGVQLYGVDDNNRRSRAGKLAVKTTDAAKAIAVDSNAAAKKEADAAKAAASAPTAQSGGSSSTNQRPPIYDDGVVPGSFFGDVVLFAGVIFTALVAIDLIVTGIAAALEAAAAYFAVEAVESAAAGVGAAVEAVGGAIVEGAEAVGEAASEVGSIGNVIINEGMNLLGKAVCFVFC